jgi:hypothetical protein
MSSQIGPKFPELRQPSTTQGQALDAALTAELEVNVMFTDCEGTPAALKTAQVLAHDLRAHINLLVFQVVPMAFPLDLPPVAIPFTEHRLAEFARQAAQGSLDTDVRLYLCRDRQQALLRVLKPGSLLVIGETRRWWPGDDRKLARKLRSQGYQVVLASAR